MLIIAAFVGCTLAITDYSRSGEKAEDKFYAPTVNTYEHNGHTYIVFDDIRDIDVIHDPDCKCNK